MKVNSIGILRSIVVKHYPIGFLKIVKGETSKSAVKIFKEYTADKLDLKFYVIEDKVTNKVRTRLLHINNKRVIYKKDRS